MKNCCLPILSGVFLFCKASPPYNSSKKPLPLFLLLPQDPAEFMWTAWERALLFMLSN